MPASEKYLPCPTRERGHNGDAKCERSGYPSGAWSGLLALQTGQQHPMSPGLSIYVPHLRSQGWRAVHHPGRQADTHSRRAGQGWKPRSGLTSTLTQRRRRLKVSASNSTST